MFSFQTENFVNFLETGSSTPANAVHTNLNGYNIPEIDDLIGSDDNGYR